MDPANIYECKPYAKHGARSLKEWDKYKPCPPGAYGQFVGKRPIDQLVTGMQGW